MHAEPSSELRLRGRLGGAAAEPSPELAGLATVGAGGLGLLLFRQMAMSNYGGIATVILAVLALIVFGEVVSYYARRAVI